MGFFSTRNSDGASGLGEPCGTVSRAEAAKLTREAGRHMCDSTAELFSAPTVSGSGGRGGFDPARAGEN